MSAWEDADVARGERAARQLLADLKINHPVEVDIDTLAYMRGALVRDIPMNGAQGRSCRIGARAIISVNEQVTYVPRRRYVVAHELGHLEIHRDKNQLSLCAEASISERYDQGTEREANAFASALLMPKALWDKRVDVKTPSLDVVSNLSREFQVSFTAAAIRFVKLCPERCAAVFSQDNRVVWAALGTDFGYSIRRDDQLSTYTLASDFFKKGSVAERMETISAQGWLESRRVGRDHDLKEQCRVISSIAATLSLLWIPPDSDF
ncbi:MAG: ImmA/IrrE family metallo-endopeptidase [Myxococcales bacterium]|jgi:Zn-dependent peptidase ImmA (M78 family)|nr:ImmA/IrrE family metallo-endopeptidase [Myxococcales bacterium]